jgi:hypothetical protein
MRNASHEVMEVDLKHEMDIKTMACQEMEVHQEEKKPTSLDRKPEAAQKEEVLAEDAEVMPVGELKKRCRDRNQRNTKKRTQVKDGCRRSRPSPAEQQRTVVQLQQ